MSKKFNRKKFIALSSGVLATGILAACGDTPTPTSAPAPTAAATTAAKATTAATSATTAASGNMAAVTTVAPVANGIKTGVTDTEILFGNFSPQSGGAAGYGVVARVLDAFFKKVNDEGGVYGRKLKLVYEDDAYQAAKTTAVVKKMVEQDKVFALVGGIGTANNLAIRDYLNENNVPSICFSTGSGALVQMPSAKIHFGLLTNYTFEGQVFAKYAAETLKAQKAAVVYQNDGFGKEAYNSFVKVAKEKGLQVAAEVSYETGATDLSAQALKLSQSGADVVFVNAVPGPGAAVVKEMNKLGYKPKILTTFVLNDPSFLGAVGTAAEGIYTSSFTPLPDSTDTKVAKFRDFMKKYLPNEQVGSFAMWGYLGAEILHEALKRAGKDLSRETLVAGMESIQNWKESLAANINYGPNNRAPQNSIYIIQFKEGKFVQITDPITA